MMKKLLMCLVIVGLGLALTASQALAMDLSALIGELQVQFENIDLARVYTTTNSSLPTGYSDSLALVTVTGINNTSTGFSNAWAQSQNEFLTGMLYGLDDTSVTVANVGTGIYVQYIEATGGYIDLYLKSTGLDLTTNNSLTLTELQAFGLNRPTDEWNAIGTDDELFLRLAFVPGTYSATVTYNALTGAISGSSDAFLSVVGGSAMSLFDSNEYDSDYAGADMYLIDSFSTTELTPAQRTAGWSVGSSGDVLGSGVPEPASMILMGIGLLGAVRLRRRTA
jgi:hypothetical protein